MEFLNFEMPNFFQWAGLILSISCFRYFAPMWDSFFNLNAGQQNRLDITAKCPLPTAKCCQFHGTL